jgi:hypothetical protein
MIEAMRTGEPRKSERRNLVPSALVALKSGAISPTAAADS